MRPMGVRLRLTMWFVGVMMVMLILYSAWIGMLLWKNLAEALDHHLAEDFRVAVEMIEPAGERITWRGADFHDPGYEGDIRRWVEVWSPDGRLLFSRGSPEARTLQRVLPAPAPGQNAQVVDTPGGRLRTLARLVNLHGTPVVVRVARTERAEWEDLRPTLLALALGIPLGLIAAGAGGYVMARRALAPVALMTEQALNISAERLHQRLPVDNPGDELGRLATVFNDTFGRLERSFGLLRRFTADASHELRTPLTALRSVGEVGLSEGRTPDEYRDIIGSMLEEAGRLSRLVDGLLVLSRADSGHVALRGELCDVGEIVRDVAGQLVVLAEEKGQRLRVEAVNGARASLDRLVFRQAVINLVDNAIKYSPAGTEIVASVRREGSDVVIDVADEGPGIAAEHRDHIFERFYRADHARSQEIGGSGLGLSIARWAVEAHGGRLTLQPDPPCGSCFRITLPLAIYTEARLH